MQNENQVPIEQNIFEKEAALHIHKVLHNMQEPYKEVFSLRVFGQLSFGEIAGLFSKTESWARRILLRQWKSTPRLQRIISRKSLAKWRLVMTFGLFRDVVLCWLKGNRVLRQ